MLVIAPTTKAGNVNPSEYIKYIIGDHLALKSIIRNTGREHDKAVNA